MIDDVAVRAGQWNVSTWSDVELGDVLTLQRGFDLPARLRTDGPYPIVSSAGITGTHAEYKAEPPGIVIGRYGSLGSVHWVTDRYWPLNTSLWVKDFKGNDPRYLSYLLQTVSMDGSTASAVPGVNRNHLHTILVRCPDIGTQRRIAAVLSTFDELIEINDRRIELLEDLARSLYREWFVRFRFPGHEDVDLVDSELGPIPAEWEVKGLGEVAEALLDGDWIETKDQGGRDYRLLQVSNVAVGAFRETGNYRYVTEDTFKRLRCTALRVGDILISRMPDPIGRAWLIDCLAEPAITAVDVAILRPLSRPLGFFLNFWLNSPSTLAQAEAVSTGTTRKRIARSVLSALKVVVPSPAHLTRFADHVAPMLELRSGLVREIECLAVTRDLLLPRLVTGKLDISRIDLGELLPVGAA